MRTRLSLLALLIAVPLLGAASPATAAPNTCTTPSAAALDEVFAGSAPAAPGGVVISLVSGDRTVATKAYGPLDPDRSLMRIASITKLFTWTAVMQQVEAGRLDLNADVNTYLKAFKIPSTYPQPITLLTLMNHTAGFEDRVVGVGALRAADVPPLGEYLAEHMPKRIRPPGEVSAYSNYGAALAGYIVSQVSGQSWDSYVQQHLLDPLGMTHSTATEPVPAALAADLAASYNTDSGTPERVPFEFDLLSPDGAISATATDMAKFMIAQLNQGRGLLNPATAALMQQTSYTADPRVGGYAHGFMVRTINGHRVLMHDGGWEGFGSVLVLVPDCHLGLFLSTDTTGGTEALSKLMPAFFNRFLPVVPTTPVPAAATGAPQPGFYRPTRHNESTLEKLTTLLGPARLKVDADGTVHFRGKDWTAQGGGLYRPADGDDNLVAHGDLVATDGPVYELMSPAETLPVNLIVLLAVAVLGLTAMAVPLARLRRNRRAVSGRWRLSRSLAAGAAGLSLVFVVLLVVSLLGDTSAFLYGVPLSFSLLLALPIVVLTAAGAALAGTVTGWRGAGAGVIARIHQIALLAGLLAFTWFVWQWNLIGWQYS